MPIDFSNITADNIGEKLQDISEQLAEFFLTGLPAQMPDKVQNVTTAFSEVLRIYGDIMVRVGEARATGNVVAASEALNNARFFLEDTVRFIKSSTSIDDFRKNSYIWAKRHCSAEAAASMGTTAGTPEDYI